MKLSNVSQGLALRYNPQRVAEYLLCLSVVAKVGENRAVIIKGINNKMYYVHMQ